MESSSRRSKSVGLWRSLGASELSSSKVLPPAKAELVWISSKADCNPLGSGESSSETSRVSGSIVAGMLLTELLFSRQEGNFSMLPRKTKACDRLQAFKARSAKDAIS